MKVGIIGVGLMGGSIAKALHQEGVALYLDDAARDVCMQLAEQRLGVVSPWTAWIADVDAVVIGVPLGQVTHLVDQVAPHMQSGAWLVDFSSVKSPLQETFRRAAKHVSIMALHLMAGREVTGFGASSAELLKGCPMAVVDVAGGFPDEDTVLWWQERLHTAPASQWTIEEHDRAVAWISQLPYLVSRILRELVETDHADALTLKGPGYRDTTRVGKGSLEALYPMLQTNARELDLALGSVETQIREWRTRLGKENSASCWGRSS